LYFTNPINLASEFLDRFAAWEAKCVRSTHERRTTK